MLQVAYSEPYMIQKKKYTRRLMFMFMRSYNWSQYNKFQISTQLYFIFLRLMF
jgi:hypothetical protein